jgi:signal transduction histidine kinase
VSALGELAEVPMMAAMFVAMVWHARRHQGALEALRRSNEREHEFIRDASHQLRTPITVARGHAELVRGGAVDAQSVDDLEVVIEELDRLSRISDRLLILATAEHRALRPLPHRPGPGRRDDGPPLATHRRPRLARRDRHRRHGVG